MKKYYLWLFLFVIPVLISSCGKTEPSLTEEPLSNPAEEALTEAPPMKAEEEMEPLQELMEPEEDPISNHSHQWFVSAASEATCIIKGTRYWICSCGAKKEESLAMLPHTFAKGACGKNSVCISCGALGDVTEHSFSGNVCSRCSFTITSPVYVLGSALEFDEPINSIVHKLGAPTEILMEGDLKSLVYASDLSRLTVVQTDSIGLWGVFTLDPAAFFQINGEIVKASDFSGRDDPESDADYRELGSCRIFGFRDHLGTGKHYALWMRYSECDYHFMLDSRITQNYAVQSRLSYYYVNALRALNGLSPLAWSAVAAQVSTEYSGKMAEENFFYHDDLYGIRLNSAGIVWRSCGENISQGYTSAFFVCDAYYNCQDHRNNILSTSFTHVGMGFYLQSDSQGPLAVLGTQTFYS